MSGSESIGAEPSFNTGTLSCLTTPPFISYLYRSMSSQRGKTCLASLVNRSFAWSVLNLDDVFAALSLAEAALVRAYADKNFKLARSGLQADLNKARKRDSDKMMTRLEHLAAGLDSDIVCTLQTNEKGRPYQLKELTTAFTKRIRVRTPLSEGGPGETPNITPFLHKAANALQRLSGRPTDYDIPPWSLTSLDVDFDVDDARLVGRGAFGRVVKGDWKGKIVAVKELSPPNPLLAMDSIRHEVQIWSRLSHPNVLPFYGACLESSKPFIVSQFCSAGSALKYLRTNPHVNHIELLHGIASGMVYLHEHGVIHADLKASNILISDAGEALIADFGLSQVQDQVSSSIHITRTSAERIGGTFRWMAPELLMGKGLNKPADIYSFALTAWEFYTNGAIPFGDIADARQFSILIGRGERPYRPPEMGDGMWGLLQRCWKSEFSERPDFVDIKRVLTELLATEEKSPTLTPPKRRFSLSTGAGTDGKSTFLKGLVNTKGVGPPKEPKVACISPKSRHTEKHRPPSDELGFLMHAHKLPSLSWISTESGPNAPPIGVTLAFLYDHSLKLLPSTPISAEGVSEILAETGLVPAAIIRLLRPSLPESEAHLLLGLLANLACHGTGRSAIVTQPQIMEALRAFLPSKSKTVQENVTRCLYNLSTTDSNNRLLADAEGIISSLGGILFAVSSVAIAKNVLGCLTNLSLKDPGKSVILSTTDAVSGLLYALRPGTDDITKEQALLCIGNLSVDQEKGVTSLLAHSETIARLSTCLCEEESPTPAIKAQSLRCLRNLAKSGRPNFVMLSSSGSSLLKTKVANGYGARSRFGGVYVGTSTMGRPTIRQEPMVA
ncbi:hypothetical protein DXG01_009685 [Tephrocybe rancida]|nr:hypothetical protein DXG01_009685 [Tephrocybe rancida]